MEQMEKDSAEDIKEKYEQFEAELTRLRALKDELEKKLVEKTQEEQARAEELERYKECEQQWKTEKLLLDEREKKTGEVEAWLGQREKRIEEKEHELREVDKELVSRKLELDDKEQKSQGKEQILSDWAKKINDQRKEMTIRETEIANRELELHDQETKLEQEKQSQQVLLGKELLNKRKEFEQSLGEERIKYTEELHRNFADLRTEFERALEEERARLCNQMNDFVRKERDERLNVLEAEIAERKEEIERRENQLKERNNGLNERENKLAKQECDLEVREQNLALKKRRLELEDQRLDDREGEIEDIVEDRMKGKEKEYRDRISDLMQECEELREQVKNANNENLQLQSIRAIYPEGPEILQKQIQEARREKDRLARELAERPEKELADRYEVLKQENEQLKRDKATLEKENQEFRDAPEQISRLESQNRLLQSQKENYKSERDELDNRCQTLQARIERLSTAEGRLADRDERIEEIKRGIITDMFNSQVPNEPDEIKWLEGIRKNCKEYGLSFQKRILYAFHTALKIADWSTITVLAGVSGTGKSELPRLYAKFGGLNFINVPVQPNWDSQESMLGFFNSIDNRFDPQPLLRFLVQCTEDEEYSNYMSIVLLDEMNLAHVEHYFAEFLSKLESRRGTNKDHVPTVEVKLGAGVAAYQLKLARTILWTGTMNQDETTKSLSDKVLDRGIVINFPRPTSLSRRKDMGNLDDMVVKSGRPMLRKGTWSKWIKREITFEGDQLDELLSYKSIVEQINDSLEGVGRALGHRVWQSIEYYIANYPLVIAAQNEAKGELTSELKAAMQDAFEDQIVQKIMPKLRGIETRGKGEEKLREIEQTLEDAGFDKLKDDFEIACEQGYGQFMWSSAKYIEADEEMHMAGQNDDVGGNEAKEEEA